LRAQKHRQLVGFSRHPVHLLAVLPHQRRHLQYIHTRKHTEESRNCRKKSIAMLLQSCTVQFE
jgi:histidinol phosphatase-like enzyme